MTLLDDVLRGDVRRLLSEAGFGGRGKTLRRAGPAGSLAIILFWPLDGITSKSVVNFVVQFGVFVPKVRPWLSADLQLDVAARQRDVADCQAYASLRPSPQSAWARIDGGPDDGSWGLIDTEPTEPVRLDLLAGLRDEVLPLLDHLLHVRSGLVADETTPPRVRVLSVREPFSPAPAGPIEALYSWPEPNPPR